jgi:hypothetical protein
MLWRAVILATVMGVAPAVAQDVSASAPSGNWIAPVEPATSDAELEQIVRAAYQAAIDYAATNKNYFARDGVTAPLRDAVAAGLAQAGFSDVAVTVDPAPTLAAARTCLGRAGTELRFVVNVFGDGLSLAAVTAARDFAYEFDPREMSDVLVHPAEACTPAN